MDDEIIKKLKSFLRKHSPMTEECHVVYLMVEIRKVLEGNEIGNDKYPLLRFYCDWVMHAKKDRITKEIKEIMDRIDRSYTLEDKKRRGKIDFRDNIKFIYMSELRKEMKKFFQDFDLPCDLVKYNDKWLPFLWHITSVLVDQPIVNPINNIVRFSFNHSDKGPVIWMIEFNDERGKCEFGNVY